MEKPKWRATALAFATAVLLGMSASDASALALGPVTVQSALGEPLRARIDIPEINAEELASLRVAIASPAAYRTAGLDYSAAVSAITVKLESRPDGRPYLSVTSSRPVTEPFLDLLLETTWASGRIVRDYTMLFDPPVLRQSAPPVAAQVSPAPRANTAAPTAPAAPSTSAPAAAPSAAAPNAAAPRAAASSPAAERPVAVPKTPAGDAKQLTVKAGDTAGRLAAANKPANVSLDQMLVAMLRANPDAFIGGNVNRLKSGAVLDVPREEDAALVPSDEARQTLVAQSRDFNEFRRKLAEALPTTPTAEADRQAKGKVQAQVEEKKPAAAAPDKLTLSKGAVQARGGEDKIARDRAAQDAAARVAELNKNITELNKLGTATAPAAAASSAKSGIALPVGPAAAVKPAAPAPAPATAPAAPVVKAPELPAPAAVATPAPAAVAPVPAASAATAVGGSAMAVTPAIAPAEAPVAAASAAAPESPAIAPSPAASAAAVAPAPAASGARAKPVPAPAAPVETSLMDELLDNPMVPVAAGGILALLLGFGFYRVQQRKKSAQVDSSFLESRLQPDSFFGASGGQRVDTAEAAPTGSSMVYSPSQLDAAGDVDPVAEADVYLAYGRDLQAEEILKEAMRTTPQRVAIHSKLLEIYAKRRDAKGFEVVAAEAYSLTRGEGPEWEHICGLGQELDASNPLYRPGGQPARAAGAAASAVAPAATVAATQPMPMDTAAAAADVDLDLDFSLGDDVAPAPATSPAAARPAAVEPTRTAPAPVAELMPSLDLDFQSTGEPAEQHAPELTLGNDSLSFIAEPAKAPAPAPVAAARPAVAPAAPAAAPAPDAGMIEFDLGALSLDLEPPAAAAPATPAAAAPVAVGGSTDGGGDMSNDPLATKLALAQEFNAIGDPDGARSLAQEVLAEASGDLKSRAQRFLAEIS